MFSHVMVDSNHIERSKKFYDGVFQAVGGKPEDQDQGPPAHAHKAGVFVPPFE